MAASIDSDAGVAPASLKTFGGDFIRSQESIKKRKSTGSTGTVRKQIPMLPKGKPGHRGGFSR